MTGAQHALRDTADDEAWNAASTVRSEYDAVGTCLFCLGDDPGCGIADANDAVDGCAERRCSRAFGIEFGPTVILELLREKRAAVEIAPVARGLDDVAERYPAAFYTCELRGKRDGRMRRGRSVDGDERVRQGPSAREFLARLRYDEDRHVGPADNVLSGASNRHPIKTAPPVRAHDDEIRGDAASEFQDFLAGRAIEFRAPDRNAGRANRRFGGAENGLGFVIERLQDGRRVRIRIRRCRDHRNRQPVYGERDDDLGLMEERPLDRKFERAGGKIRAIDRDQYRLNGHLRSLERLLSPSCHGDGKGPGKALLKAFRFGGYLSGMRSITVTQRANVPFSRSVDLAEQFFKRPHRLAVGPGKLLRAAVVQESAQVRDVTDGTMVHEALMVIWQARLRLPLPDFHGLLTVRVRAPGTEVNIQGSYVPPFGIAGQLFDSVIGRRIARVTFQKLLDDVCAYLEAQYDNERAARNAAVASSP